MTATFSPSPKKVEGAMIAMNFYDALKVLVEENASITRLEWENPNIYLKLIGGHLKICLEDGLFHDLIVTDIDLLGKDWVIVDYSNLQASTSNP